jgi:hypothetical protein
LRRNQTQCSILYLINREPNFFFRLVKELTALIFVASSLLQTVSNGRMTSIAHDSLGLLSVNLV